MRPPTFRIAAISPGFAPKMSKGSTLGVNTSDDCRKHRWHHLQTSFEAGARVCFISFEQSFKSRSWDVLVGLSCAECARAKSPTVMGSRPLSFSIVMARTSSSWKTASCEHRFGDLAGARSNLRPMAGFDDVRRRLFEMRLKVRRHFLAKVGIFLAPDDL